MTTTISKDLLDRAKKLCQDGNVGIPTAKKRKRTDEDQQYYRQVAQRFVTALNKLDSPNQRIVNGKKSKLSAQKREIHKVIVGLTNQFKKRADQKLKSLNIDLEEEEEESEDESESESESDDNKGAKSTRL